MREKWNFVKIWSTLDELNVLVPPLRPGGLLRLTAQVLQHLHNEKVRFGATLELHLNRGAVLTTVQSRV